MTKPLRIEYAHAMYHACLCCRTEAGRESRQCAPRHGWATATSRACLGACDRVRGALKDRGFCKVLGRPRKLLSD